MGESKMSQADYGDSRSATPSAAIEMIHSSEFLIDRSGYSVQRLRPEAVPVMQRLYEQCTEFALLTMGEPFSSTEAQDEFGVLPSGKTADDKYLLGLFDPHHELIGLMEAICGYPDDRTWWVGLLLLNPAQRCQGLATNFYQ
jgi:hypothetical protein